ncbi:MAG: hypothetical protein ABIH66_08990 [bacterium]
METEKRILHLLLGRSRNKIRYIHGLDRQLVNLLMVRNASKKTRKYLRESSASLADVINMIDSQIFLAADILVKRIAVLRFLFGMRMKRK